MVRRRDPLPELISVRMAAQRLGVHRDTLMRWVRDGRLRSVDLSVAIHGRPGVHYLTKLYRADIERIIAAGHRDAAL